MNRFLSILVSLVLLAGMIAATTSTAFAATDNSGLSSAADENPTVRYSHTGSISASLSYNSGRVHASGIIVPSGRYAVKIYLSIYKQTSTGWTRIGYWTDSSAAGAIGVGGSVAAPLGTYKVLVTGNVDNGSEYPSKSFILTF